MTPCSVANLVWTGNSIHTSYDSFGRKLWVRDPNQGHTQFTYNDFGELEKEVDANADVIRYDYDMIGRLTSRLAPQANASFGYNARGLMDEETAPNFKKEFVYDASARVEQITTTIDNASSYVMQTQYDSYYGRPKAYVYPNGLTVALRYTNTGYLSHEENAATGYVYREVTTQDSWGNITQANLGNDTLTGTYQYHAHTGQMHTSEVDKQGAVLHSLEYTQYDSFGNIKAQVNRVQGFTATETFEYDDLFRLLSSTVNAGDTSVGIDYAYDAVGNLTKKTDYSSNSD